MIFCLAIWDWDDVSLVFTGRSLDRGRMFVPPPEKTAGSGCLRRGLKIRGQDGRVQLTIEIHDLKSRTMTLRQQYFKRYRMELDVGGMLLPAASLPNHFFWVAWDATDVDRHALVKHRSFRDEVDAEVFPSLGEYPGCQRLMRDISQQAGFLGPSTWLIIHDGEGGASCDCGTIQGLSQSAQVGSIQNVGVVPEYRGLGLGRALVLRSLWGFAMAGHQRTTLEVTATNFSAVELYRSLGFRVVKTMYRSAPLEEFVY